MSRRASFDIFQGNATLFLFRDAFAPHRRDPACTDELAAPAPASEPEISPDGDPYGHPATVARHCYECLTYARRAGDTIRNAICR